MTPKQRAKITMAFAEFLRRIERTGLLDDETHRAEIGGLLADIREVISKRVFDVNYVDYEESGAEPGELAWTI